MSNNVQMLSIFSLYIIAVTGSQTASVHLVSSVHTLPESFHWGIKEFVTPKLFSCVSFRLDVGSLEFSASHHLLFSAFTNKYLNSTEKKIFKY